MNSLFIKDFRFGLDTRKSELTQRPGTLEVLTNGFVNQGGEVENRKAFVRTARVAGTFGLQPTSAGLYNFGSEDLSAQHPVNIGTVGTPINVQYQRLQHPAVLFGTAYSAGSHAMTAVTFSEQFRGKAVVAATFADGNTFVYYDGSLVRDFTDGLRMSHLNSNALLAQDLARMLTDRSTTFIPSHTPPNTYVDVTGPVQLPYAIDSQTELQGGSTGVLTTTLISEATSGSAGVYAKAKFRVIAGKTNAAASSVLTNDGTAPADGSSVTINGVVYTFRTVITLSGDVLIGNTANGDAAMQNLISAINHTGVPNTDYIKDAPHPNVQVLSSYDTGANTFVLTARVTGTPGNAITTTTAGTSHVTWTGATLAGGLNTNKITSIKAGLFEILGADVIWEKDAITTATNVVTQILTYNTGYTAENVGEDIFITAPIQSTESNGLALSVTTSGQLCIGSLFAAFVSAGTGFTLTTFSIDSVDIKGALSGGAATSSYATLALFCEAVADSIYATGLYTAVAKGNVVYVSKIITSSSDLPLNAFVTITPAAGGTGSGVTVNNVPQEGTAEVILDKYTVFGSGTQLNNSTIGETTTASVFFGSAPYVYEWEKLDGNVNMYKVYTGSVNYNAFYHYNVPERAVGTYSARFRVKVTDINGVISYSDPVTAFITLTP